MSSQTRPHEKLDTWQLGRMLVKEIYQLTEDYPDDEKFRLAHQMRKAAI